MERHGHWARLGDFFSHRQHHQLTHNSNSQLIMPATTKPTPSLAPATSGRTCRKKAGVRTRGSGQSKSLRLALGLSESRKDLITFNRIKEMLKQLVQDHFDFNLTHAAQSNAIRVDFWSQVCAPLNY